MDDILSNIKTDISSKGGSIDWNTYMSHLPEREKARAYVHIKNWESQNAIRREVVVVEGLPVFRIVVPKVGG
jgi:hypothetical protein